MIKYICWIDGKTCHSKNEDAIVSFCTLCQDSKLKRLALKKGMNPFNPKTVTE